MGNSFIAKNLAGCFILIIIFGSALFGGINSYLPLIEVNSDLPFLIVAAAIFCGALVFQTYLIPFFKSNCLPLFPLVIYGLVLFFLSFFSPYVRLSHLELLKYIGCVFLLSLVWGYLYFNKKKRLSFILIYALVIDVIAVLNLSGWILRVPDVAFYGYDVTRGRLFGTMLYSNTAAAFLLPALFIHLVYAVIAPHKKNLFLHTLGAALCMMNIVLSMSRGTEIILCAMYFPIIFFLRKAHRWKMFLILFILQNSALLLLPSQLNLYYINAIYSICLLSIITILGIYLPSCLLARFLLPKLDIYVRKKIPVLTGNYQSLILTAMIIFCLIIPFWKLPHFAPYNSPETEWMVVRAEKWTPFIHEGKLKSEDKSIHYRLETLRFAYNMFLEKPWIGFGPGIYPLAYLQYRTFDYPWNSPHALLLEKLIELGILGFLGFGILLFAFVKRLGFMAWNTKKYLPRVLLCSVIALFAHACMDKDWNYYAMQLNLWITAGITLSYFSAPVSNISRSAGTKSWLFSLLVIVLTIYVLILMTGGIYMQVSKNFARGGDFQNAVKWAEKAAVFDKWNAEYAVQIAKYIDTKQDILTNEDEGRMKFWLEKALRLCPILPSANHEMSKLQWMQGDEKKAVYYQTKLRKIDPLGTYPPFIGPVKQPRHIF